MIYLITCDIESSKKRKFVSEILLSHGFKRIQKSVFLSKENIKFIEEVIGDIKIRKVRKLLFELSGVIDLEKDALCILNICEKCYGKGIFISRNMNYKMIEEEFLII